MDLGSVIVLMVLFVALAALALGAIALVRWAQRMGRRVWLWLLGSYIAANIVWAIVRPFLAQP